ncbi:MAG: hypothetical protein C0596_01430 [Marinilabiliales bacterium]|nr:MAG: hypothetical protein C0596_01430 [Marinilabiliales bacterium]
MKKAIIISLVTAALVYLLSGCERESSADVTQDRIYVSYEIVYHETTDITYARASFFFGSITGTKLELADPSQVTFNGDPLGFKDALAYYEKQYTGLVETGEFIFTDLDDNSFTNTATISEIGLPETLDTITKGSSYELFFTGDALVSGEGVYAYINGTGEGDGISVYQNTTGATSIVIPATQTDNLTVGTNTVYLRKRHETAAQEASSAGAICAGIYQTVTVDIEVIE